MKELIELRLMMDLDKLAKQLNREERNKVKDAFRILLRKLYNGANYSRTRFTCGWINESSWLIEGWKLSGYDKNGIRMRIIKRVWDVSGNSTDEQWEVGTMEYLIPEILKHLN
jgi:hypothetical protein